MLIKTVLNTWVGKNVREFCPHTKNSILGSDKTLHCAHFVSHVLNIDSPKWKGTVIIRVNELAERCTNFRLLPKATKENGLVFVAPADAFVFKKGKCTGIKGKKRHVGLYLNGTVWHYENDSTEEKVVSQDVWTQKGISKFHNRYGKNCEVYIADLPKGVIASTWSKSTPT
jgi:hypothetical protein